MRRLAWLLPTVVFALGCGDTDKRQPSRGRDGEQAGSPTSSSASASSSAIAASSAIASSSAAPEPTSSALDYSPGPETATVPTGSVSSGPSSVSGRLPPEVIRRVVRSRNANFRACYEVGLKKNPNLRGLVEVSFVIGRDGGVGSVGNGVRTDLPDVGVLRCVSQAFYKLEFPKPDGGVVKVTYPLVFSPG